MEIKQYYNRNSDTIFQIENFWSKKVCIDIIDDLETSNMFSDSESNFLKKNSLEDNIEERNKNRILYNSEELANEIWGNLQNQLRVIFDYKPIGINKEFRFYRYTKGQEFKPHQDWPCKIGKNLKSYYSLLIYLNEEFEGGYTKFNELEIKPQTGSAVFFKHEIFHSSTKILSGLKYILRTDIISEV
jgi:prolyl 4-hydroxylase